MLVKPLQLNTLIADWVPMNWPHCLEVKELFGVEVELEGMGGITNPVNEVMAKWDVHNDNSLRKLKPGDEAIEYVTKVPGTREETFQAVKVLTDFLNMPKHKVYDSYRTSIHVHVNCMADTMMHVCNFVTLCVIFDELLTSQNGDHRIGNNFCLRSKDAEGQIVDLVKSIENHGTILGIGQNNRYSSINFASLNKFGTVEFRSLECTTDPLRILHWIKTIDMLKQASRTFEDPQDVIRKFSQMSVQEFLFKVLDTCAPKYYKVLGYEDMLFNGMRLAQEFAYCSKWIVQEKNKKNDEIKDYVKAIKQAQAEAGFAMAPPQFQQQNNGQWAVDIEAGGVQFVQHHIDDDPQPVPMGNDVDFPVDDDDFPDMDDDF